MPPKPTSKPSKKGGPVKPPSKISMLKARMDAMKKLEEEQKRLDEEEEKRIREEDRLAEEQRKIELEEKAKQNDLAKEKKKENKVENERTRNMEAIERMRMSGMIMPEQYTNDYPVIEIKNLVTVQKEKPQKIKQTEQTEQDDTNNKIDLSLRAPICCVLGHVDSGKTTLLDHIRKTNVQGKEARGITQQIGATFLPYDTLVEKCGDKYKDNDINIPGLLILDTPGHESFVNLRDRGSSICDVAILVVDIMSGLEPQTIESIRFLKKKKCPFIVALNKIDRLYEWKSNPDMDIRQSLSLQQNYVISEYDTRVSNILLQLTEEGLNVDLFYKNNDMTEYISVVPISAVTGEGISDLMAIKIGLIQKYMKKKITFKPDVECTVMDVKPIHNMGLTIDVILVNGILCTGDKIVLCGINGPIVTKIKKLLTPQPLKETRVKGEYDYNKMVKGAICVKIMADNLENVVSGSKLFVVGFENNEAELEREVMEDMKGILSKISKDIGISIQSSTLGSLEAILNFLEHEKIPVNHISLGPINKKHLVSVINMKEKHPKFAVVLAFDVETTDEAKKEAEKNGITIYSSNIIYTLFDHLKKYMNNYDAIIKEKNKQVAVFPVSLEIIDVFRRKDPMIIGCHVQRGKLRKGTPLCIRSGDDTQTVIGKVIGLQVDNKDIDSAKESEDIAVKIQCPENNISFGRTVDKQTILCSKVTRRSIDALKESFRDEMSNDDWKLIIELKKEQNIN
jgi:translation initiation factor 5B